MTRRVRTLPAARKSNSDLPASLSIPRAVAVACALVGVLNLLWLIVPRWHHSLNVLTEWLPFDFAGAGGVAVALSGLLLLYLAHGLARGKAMAWLVAVVMVLLSLLGRIAAGHGLLVLVPSLAVLILLVWGRRHFTASADPVTRRHGALLSGAMGVAGLALGLVVLQVRLPPSTPLPSFPQRIRDVVLGMVGVPTAVDAGDSQAADFLYYSLLGIGLAVALVVLWSALAPSRPSSPQTPIEEQRLRELLRQHGSADSLGYFALRDDKSAVFSRDGRAAVAFKVVGGVMLAAGDPVGARESWPEVTERFVAQARSSGWTPAVLGSSREAARVWADSGLRSSIGIGDESVVEVGSFTLVGRSMRNLRQMVNRAQRRGWTVTIRRLDTISADECDELARAAIDWRVGAVERGYSMALGRFTRKDDGQCVVATARRDGVLGGLVVLVPWGDRGLSLDLMRRRGVDDAGVIELLLTEVIEHSPSLGIDAVSLNFAAFRSSITGDARRGWVPVRFVWQRCLRHADRWLQLESLHRFSAKFSPRWQSRCLVFPARRDFPRVALAALQAERFLVPPRWLTRRSEHQIEIVDQPVMA